MSRLRAIALGGMAGAAVILLATGWLVFRAVTGASDREATRHGLLAEELFDTLEGELSDLVAREEQRSFLDYQYNADALTAAWGPDRRDLVGYFQIGPDGIAQPPDMPEELAAAVAHLSLPNVVVPPEVVETGKKVDKQALISTRVQEQVKTNPLGSLKRGAVKRTNRVEQQAKIDVVSAAAFNSSGPRTVPPATHAPIARAVNPIREIDVRISPIEGASTGPHLVLHRNVTVGALTTRQGVVLRTDDLVQHLESTVLGDSPLRAEVQLAWNGQQPMAAAHVFAHQFAAPFESMVVRASLQRIEEASTNEARSLLGLALLVVTVVVLGGWGLFRAVRAEIELAQRRSDFASAVTHELKTPLTTIRMYAEMLRDGLVAGAERQQEYHATIVGESERLSRLVGNVLTLSRLERGSAGPVLQPVPIAPLLHEVTELVQPVLRRTEATLDVQMDPDLPSVLIDRDGLIHALANLVDNAVKFAAKATDQRVHLHARRHDDGVALSVRDHGPGVPSHQLNQIFEPFFRGEREITRTTQGTGIGLALVKGTVVQAEGRVTALAAPDGGLEVVVHLKTAHT